MLHAKSTGYRFGIKRMLFGVTVAAFPLAFFASLESVGFVVGLVVAAACFALILIGHRRDLITVARCFAFAMMGVVVAPAFGPGINKSTADMIGYPIAGAIIGWSIAVVVFRNSNWRRRLSSKQTTAVCLHTCDGKRSPIECDDCRRWWSI
jgi:hypothetical protein